MTFKQKLVEYLKERYTKSHHEEVADIFQLSIDKRKYKVIDKPYGFVTYELKGDACIIHDMFTLKEYRGQGKAWDLFYLVRDEAQRNPNCRVMISFSEFAGKNHHNGQAAMLSAGFTPAYLTSDRIVYMRGTI